MLPEERVRRPSRDKCYRTFLASTYGNIRAPRGGKTALTRGYRLAFRHCVRLSESAVPSSGQKIIVGKMLILLIKTQISLHQFSADSMVVERQSRRSQAVYDLL